MARTYEYAILTAVPNPRRGERVNVGIVVFRPDRIDVRFKQATYKLRAITGENWDTRIENATSCFEGLYDNTVPPSEVLAQMGILEPLLKPSQLGWLSVTSDDEYEIRVDEILKSLVALPRKERAESKSRINTEMAREFKQLHMLASRNETLEDKKIVRDFVVDPKEGLVADFALKNGKLHIASTLDLRKHSASLGDAALKSIVLDKAEKKYGTEFSIKRIGVYAVDKDMLDNFKGHIDLLGDYADELYDWQDQNNRKKFQRSLSDAIGMNIGNLFYS